jgi:hypothetical protein
MSATIHQEPVALFFDLQSLLDVFSFGKVTKRLQFREIQDNFGQVFKMPDLQGPGALGSTHFLLLRSKLLRSWLTHFSYSRRCQKFV